MPQPEPEPEPEPEAGEEVARLRLENALLRRALEAASLPLPAGCGGPNPALAAPPAAPLAASSVPSSSAVARCAAQGGGGAKACTRIGCPACSDTGNTHWFTPSGTRTLVDGVALSLTAAATVMPLPATDAPEDGASSGGGEEVGYTTQGVRVGDRLYPFPKPKYLLQLIKLCESKNGDAAAAPLLKLLTKKRYQHAKEISENFVRPPPTGICHPLTPGTFF